MQIVGVMIRPNFKIGWNLELFPGFGVFETSLNCTHRSLLYGEATIVISL